MDKIKVTVGYGKYFTEAFTSEYKSITFKRLKNSRRVLSKVLSLIQDIDELDAIEEKCVENLRDIEEGITVVERRSICAMISFGCEVEFVKFPKGKGSSEELAQKFLHNIEKTYYNMNGAT